LLLRDSRPSTNAKAKEPNSLARIGKNGQNDHLIPEQRDHPLAGAN
jgi:hypothetical protein